jgi:pSer/pThr/pTyr-binding forkhead associated (FHA) protein
MGVRLEVRAIGTSDEVAVYEFDQDRIAIGRGRGADVRLPHRAVSVRHASIELSGRRYGIVDHESKNGTHIGGARIVAGRPKPLRDGDRIELGPFSIVFRCDVPVTISSPERTTSLARRLLRSTMSGEDVEHARLRVLNGPSAGKVVVLDGTSSRLRIGRGEQCEVVLDDADASREHAEIVIEKGVARVRDLGSKNGIEVAGRRTDDRVLDDGDEIRIGATILAFEDPAGMIVRAIETGDDVEFTRPAPKEEPPPQIEEVEEQEPLPAAPLPEVKKKESLATADAVIYVLASMVFAVSVLGLFWLLRS